MAEVSLEQFAPLRGERFVLQLPDGGELGAELVEASALNMAPFQGRQPFSLLFKGPRAPLLPQSIYALRHATQPEALELFLVPVSADAGGVCYEAVFA